MNVFAAPSVLDGAGEEARRLGGLSVFLFAAATVVYVIVAVLVVASVVRHRRSAAEDGARFIWFGGLLMPVAVLGVLAYLTVQTTVDLPRRSHATQVVDVTGHQWWWDVRYPDGGRRTANELHLPVDQVTALRLRSVDVIHSFWVPQIAGKLDLVPGQTNTLRVLPRRTGTFLGLCAEYCGLQHANMRLTVVVQTGAAFERWLRHQRPNRSWSSLVAAGERVFRQQSCSGCHTIDADEQLIGPDLGDVGARRWLAGKAFANTPRNLARWISDPSSLKPGARMPGTRLSRQDLDAVVAYLESLR